MDIVSNDPVVQILRGQVQVLGNRCDALTAQLFRATNATRAAQKGISRLKLRQANTLAVLGEVLAALGPHCPVRVSDHLAMKAMAAWCCERARNMVVYGQEHRPMKTTAQEFPGGCETMFIKASQPHERQEEEDTHNER